MKNKKIRFSRIFAYILITLVAFVAAFPFYWIICGSTNESADVISGKLMFGTYFMENWNKLFETYDVWKIILNSLTITIAVCILALTICSIAAYAFAKYDFAGKNLIFSVLMLALMVPSFATIIPMFRLALKMNLTNTLAGVILPSIAPMFLVFFFRQSFSTFPTEIIEAARIDGSGEIRILGTIVLPSMKATFAAGVIWSFMSSWNNYLWPLLVIQTDDKKTMPLLLTAITGSAKRTDYGMLMLAILLATLPIAVIYFTMQKHFVAGMMGATKG